MDRVTSIDLRSISGKGIRSFNLFQTPSLSAAVSLVHPSEPSRRRQAHHTAGDPDGGDNPEWIESFRFNLDEGDLDLALDIQIVAQGNLPPLLGDRAVGRARIPLTDLIAEGADGSVHHVSYRVVGNDGKPNGVVMFSFNVNFPPAAVSVPANPPAVSSPAGHYNYDDYNGHYNYDDYNHFYPPPSQQSPLFPSPAGDYYPPLGRQEELAVDFSMPPATDFVSAHGAYPPSPEHLVYSPAHDLAACCYPAPAPPYGDCYAPQSGGGWLY